MEILISVGPGGFWNLHIQKVSQEIPVISQVWELLLKKKIH